MPLAALQSQLNMWNDRKTQIALKMMKHDVRKTRLKKSARKNRARLKSLLYLALIKNA